MGQKCQYCECDHAETGLCPTQQAMDDYDYEDQNEFCGQCDEGYIYSCIDGCCINAEEGCELCQRRCDFCNPLKPTPEQTQERVDLGNILSAALMTKAAD